MQKLIITSCLTGSTLIILSQFGFFEALFVFLITGAVPGTSYNVPSSTMYFLLMGSISLVIIWLVGGRVLDFFYRFTKKIFTPVSAPQPRKKQLPKRRYSQI